MSLKRGWLLGLHVAAVCIAAPVAAHGQEGAAAPTETGPEESSESGATPAAPAPASPAAATAAAPAEPVRRDPTGRTGITPYREAINRGDAAYLARNFDAAKAAYQEAITQEPQNPLGHYRLGSVHLAKEQFTDALEVWEAAKRFAVREPTLKAKILFVLADLAERQRQLPEATNRWNSYEVHANGQPSAKTYPETAADRKARIETWQAMLEQYAAVKERIAKRLEEAEKKSRTGR